jgi:hypothetical protein
MQIRWMAVSLSLLFAALDALKKNGFGSMF